MLCVSACRIWQSPEPFVPHRPSYRKPTPGVSQSSSATGTVREHALFPGASFLKVYQIQESIVLGICLMKVLLGSKRQVNFNGPGDDVSPHSKYFLNESKRSVITKEPGLHW